jgi:hypothetical protein
MQDKPAMKVRVIACSDPQMWYANRVGESIPLVREDADGYWAREPAGYLNVIKRADAVVELGAK